MRIETWAKLLYRLRNATKAGEVVWKETDEPFSFALALRDGTVVITRPMDRARVQLLDADGDEAASYSPSGPPGNSVEEDVQLFLSELYEDVAARNDSAEALAEQIIASLEQIEPF